MLYDVDELLSIGDFSVRCGLSPKMLRSYAGMGLLVPAAVDDSSGYRYYSAAQLERARVIALLRRADIPVAEIAAFFDDPDGAIFARWKTKIQSETSSRLAALTDARAALARDAAPMTVHDVLRNGDPMSHNIVAGSATHRGGRDTNQDAVLLGDGLFAVADGLGGLQRGEIASRLSLETLQAAFASQRSRSGLIAACREANQAVWDEATLDGSDSTMGTTVAAVGIVPDGEAVAIHVGDSRLYRYRNAHLDRLTDDHSITADLIRSGEIDEQDALSHPHRHILTRALGVGSTVEVDSTDVVCQAGDRLLLCTDGLFGALTQDELEVILSSAAGPQLVADELIEVAVDHGAEDNVTAVIIDIL